MTQYWRWFGVGGVAIIVICATKFFLAKAPTDDEFIRDGHVVVNGVDYGAPGEKAFESAIAAEGLIGPQEVATVGLGVFREVHDVAQLYCSIRAKNPDVSAPNMIEMTTEAFHEHYQPATSATDAMIRDAAAAEAAKFWCPSGYISTAQLPPRLPVWHQ